MSGINEQDFLFLVGFSSLVKCLWVRAGACYGVEQLKGAYLGLAALANIQLSWK